MAGKKKIVEDYIDEDYIKVLVDQKVEEHFTAIMKHMEDKTEAKCDETYINIKDQFHQKLKEKKESIRRAKEILKTIAIAIANPQHNSGNNVILNSDDAQLSLKLAQQFIGLAEQLDSI